MKKIAILSTFVLVSTVTSAQQAPPAAAPQTSVSNAEDTRLKTLEDQVRTLAEEVALLRNELKDLRETKSAQPQSEGHILLTSARVQPGMLPAAATSPASASIAPDPALPQVAQTQTYGGATSNAKLLNPDISLIGDFIGTAGRNTISPSRSLELHESEVGMQAIIDPYARADAFFSFGETGSQGPGCHGWQFAKRQAETMGFLPSQDERESFRFTSSVTRLIVR
jgi:hypothetical protein